MGYTIPVRSDLSPQQKAVLDFIRDGKESLLVYALAGTGKTSLLMECTKVIKGSGFMGAFNKPIADEFVERLRNQRSWNVKGGTIHSAGYAALRKLFKLTGSPDGSKVRSLARNVASWDRKLITAITSTVDFGKQACLGVAGAPHWGDEKSWQDVIDYYDLREEIPAGISIERFIGYCVEVYKQSLDLCESVIDFNDMLLAPLYYGAPFTKYDWVFVDEAQDLNEARRRIMFEMMHQNSRMIAVGDVNQCIYGFAGATHNSMELIKLKLGCEELPLSVTFRCPKTVVDLAQQWVPSYEAHERNIEGQVDLIKHEQFLDDQEFDIDRDVILCRNSRPLVGIAGVLRKRGIPCIVEGMSGKHMKDLAVKWGDDITIDEWLGHLAAYELREVTKWTDKKDPEKVEYVKEKCDTMREIANKAGLHNTVNALVQYIDFIFGENLPRALRLCTIHKSKGREWDRVFLVGRNRYMPSIWAKTEKDFKQEDNLAYVAVTRTKKVLVEVEVPFKQKDGTEWWEL